MQTLNDYFDAVRDAANLRGWELTHVHRDGEPGVTHFILTTERDGRRVSIDSVIHDRAFVGVRELTPNNWVPILPKEKAETLDRALKELVTLMRSVKAVA